MIESHNFLKPEKILRQFHFKLLTLFDDSRTPEESRELLINLKAKKTDKMQTLCARILELATEASRLAGEGVNIQNVIDLNSTQTHIQALPDTKDLNSPRRKGSQIFHELAAKLGHLPNFTQFVNRPSIHAGEFNDAIAIYGEGGNHDNTGGRGRQYLGAIGYRNPRERMKLARLNNVNQYTSHPSSGGGNRVPYKEMGYYRKGQGTSQGTASTGNYCSLCGRTNHNSTDVCYWIRHNGRPILVIPSQKPCSICESLSSRKVLLE